MFALPVRGNGDGGAYTTVSDMRGFWTALYAGSIVPPGVLCEMTRAHIDRTPEHGMGYGLGFWLDGPVVALFGGDQGVSFGSTYEPSSRTVCTVIANVETRIRAVLHRMQELAAAN